jgi:hypothetical protein
VSRPLFVILRLPFDRPLFSCALVSRPLFVLLRPCIVAKAPSVAASAPAASRVPRLRFVLLRPLLNHPLFPFRAAPAALAIRHSKNIHSHICTPLPLIFCPPLMDDYGERLCRAVSAAKPPALLQVVLARCLAPLRPWLRSREPPAPLPTLHPPPSPNTNHNHHILQHHHHHHHHIYIYIYHHHDHPTITITIMIIIKFNYPPPGGVLKVSTRTRSQRATAARSPAALSPTSQQASCIQQEC